MIKINLLAIPKARKVRKAAAVQYELILAGMVVGVVLAGCLSYLFALNAKISRLESERTAANSQVEKLKEKVKEVENYELNKKDLEEKNRIIEQLKKNQTVPVLLLDHVSRTLDPLKIWLLSLSAQGGKVDIDGKAITNTDIVEFINSMKSTNFFSDIQLIESRQTLEANIPVYNFKLRCILVT